MNTRFRRIDSVPSVDVSRLWRELREERTREEDEEPGGTDVNQARKDDGGKVW